LPIVGALALTAALAGPSARDAGARSATTVPYPPSDVWPAAVRFLRVDRDYQLKEKDEAAGYILFEITEAKRACRAALELVKTTDPEGRAATQLVLTIQDLPHHYEAALLDKLTTKIRDERGPPPAPARKAPAPSPGAGEAAPKEKDKDAKPPLDLDNLPGPPVWGPGTK
jgi:hypothetical protein